VDSVTHQRVVKHTLYVGNDNDFLATMPPTVGVGENPNQFFVFSFGDEDLLDFVPQQFSRGDDDRDGNDGHDNDGHGDDRGRW
jgi:hypothetical protein